MADERTRRIETVRDVERVLSSRASLQEFLDCSLIARRFGRWDLVERAGEAALAQELGRSNLKIPSIAKAARIVAEGCIGRVESLDDLAESVHEAETRIDQVALKAGRTEVGSALDGTRNWLEQLRLLIADASGPSCTKLCSQLRDIDRPDLGIQAATKALSIDPEDAVAFNTRAAAKLDAGDVPGANSDVRKAWKIEQSSYIANTFSRVLLAEGQSDLAIDMAKEAFRLDPSPISAHTLLRAAAAAEDRDAFEDATRFLATSEASDGQDRPDYWIELLAAGALIDSGQLDEASRALSALEADPGAPQKQVKPLRNKLRHHQRASQGRLDV